MRSCQLLTDRSLLAIAKMCCEIARLNVADLPLVTSLHDKGGGLWSLVEFGRRRLHHLNAFGCPLVRRADIEAMAPHFPLCKVRVALEKGFLGLSVRKNADQLRFLLELDVLAERESVAATCIQNFWRSIVATATAASIALRVVRRKKQQQAALFIQMRVRRRAAQIRVRHLRKQKVRKIRHDACLLIQRVFRGYWGRTRVAGPIRKEFLARQLARRQQSAAVLAQAYLRAWLARLGYRRLLSRRNAAASVAQHFWRRVSAMHSAKAVLEQRLAEVILQARLARIIQRFMRHCLENALARRLQALQRLQSASASTIQRFCRSVFARRDLFIRKVRYARKRNAAATKIQSFCRAAMDRSAARALARIVGVAWVGGTERDRERERERSNPSPPLPPTHRSDENHNTTTAFKSMAPKQQQRFSAGSERVSPTLSQGTCDTVAAVR